ncbi:hypothetical protein DdX_15152 [Ditylenchus destructor]|uniref:Uncharacterized protein n=1 Tax=Ditylenchus destructor TaxID=166010 RepID=A0AAD4MSZ1_9BILA|nr:hypothetical protein DdX_15152 [Ditylenchus destructor]
MRSDANSLCNSDKDCRSEPESRCFKGAPSHVTGVCAQEFKRCAYDADCTSSHTPGFRCAHAVKQFCALPAVVAAIADPENIFAVIGVIAGVAQAFMALNKREPT